MINEEYKAMLGGKSVIRELSEYATSRGAEIGYQNVFDYSLGNPSVPAPKSFTDAMVDLYENGDPVAIHGYSPSLGIPSVKDAIAENLNERFGMAYTGNHIFPTTGAAGALAHALRVVTKPGDEVITFAPYFPEYQPYVNGTGAHLTVVPADTENFQINFDAFEKALNPGTAAVLINTPNNPSGAVYSAETLTRLAEVLNAKQTEYGHDIFLIADEPYRELVYGGVEVPFLPAICPNAIYCYSYSKTLSLPGERVGFLALHPAIDDYAAVHAAVLGAGRALGYVCVSSLFQLAVAECLGQTADIAAYAANRELIYGALTDMGYACARPDGAFYLFLKSPEPDARAFCRRAMDYDILLVPGDDFGCPGYARLAYCVARSQLERSLPAFRKLAGSYGLSK
mgnify:CR=1 FL=1